MFRSRPLVIPALVALALSISPSSSLCAQELNAARLEASPSGLYWQPAGEYDGAALRVSGPVGVVELSFASGEAVDLGIEDLLSLAEGNGVGADGTYNWELRLAPRLTGEARALSEARRLGDETAVAGREAIGSGKVMHGVFSIVGGAMVVPNEEEESARGESSGEIVNRADTVDADGPGRDQVILDDLIVSGSGCFGFDCVNGESFGFDTIRLKENNLRLKFQDTSSSASFPSNDWQITANDSTNGGRNKFSIDDIDGGRTPFTIEAGAPSNSLYVEDGGRLGLGTSTPVVDIHSVSGNTPTLRLEQDGSSGFAAQTFDVAANEANFFVRDVTNGSTLPFRIRPGAPSSAIDVAADGDVGVGTASPSASVHVLRSNGTAGLLVQETSASSDKRVMMTLENSAGGLQLAMIDAQNSRQWNLTHLNTGMFTASLVGTGGAELEIASNGRVTMGPGAASVFNLAPNGNLTISGTLTQGSSRTIKDVVDSVTPEELLAGLSTLPLAKWVYKEDAERSVHLGPMAEDFFAAFGLGSDAQHIAPADLAAVALGAVKGLQAELDQRNAQIEELEQRLLALEARLPALDQP